MVIKIKSFQTNKDIEEHLIELFIDNCKEYMFSDNHHIKKIKSESPDFILYNDTIKIGIEITRALNQNLQKCFKINQQYFNGKIHICPILFEQKTQMTKKEIINQLKKSQNKIIGKPYIGNDMENIVSNEIVKSIEKKQKKFDNFEKFDMNILLIHCEMRPSLDIDIVMINIDNYIKNNSLGFDYLFIKLSKYFLYFTNNQFIKYINISN